MALVAGQKLRVSDLSGSTGGGGGGGGGAVMLAADSAPVNNSTSFADSGLSIDVVANATYFFEAGIFYVAHATADFKLLASSTTGLSGRWAGAGFGRDVSPAIDVGAGAAFVATDVGTSLTFAGDAAGTLPLYVVASGSLITTVATSFKMRFGQRTAHVSNTVIKAGSWLRLTRIA